jgi:hypothetical protein
MDTYKLDEVSFARILSFNHIGSKTLINYFGRTPGDVGLFLFDSETATGTYLDKNKIRTFRSSIAVLDEHFLVCNLTGASAPIFFLINQQGELVHTIRVANFASWKPGFELIHASSYSDQDILINYRDTKKPDIVQVATLNPNSGDLTPITQLNETEKRRPRAFALKQQLYTVDQITGEISATEPQGEARVLFRGAAPVESKGGPFSRGGGFSNLIFGIHVLTDQVQFEFSNYYDASGEMKDKSDKSILMLLPDNEVKQDKRMIFNDHETKQFYWDYPKGDIHLN